MSIGIGNMHDDSNNDSCGQGLQEHLMQSDVLVKYLLDLSSFGRVLVEGVDYSRSL